MNQRDRDGYTRMPIYIKRKHKKAFKELVIAIMFLMAFGVVMVVIGAVQAHHCQLDDWTDCVFRGKR